MLPNLHVGTHINLGHISVRSRSAQGKLTVRYSGALFTLHACVALNCSSYRFKRVQILKKELYDSDRIIMESHTLLKNDCWNQQMYLSTDKECLHTEYIK
jgi:hypothetical protein